MNISLIKDSINFLSEDFLGITVNPSGIVNWAGYLLGAFLLFLIIYGIGRIITRAFFKSFEKKSYTFFVEISLGYILIATSVFVVGLTPYLTYHSIIALTLLFAAIGFYGLVKRPIAIPKTARQLPKNGYGILLLCFMAVIFLRLIPPQTAGDPLDYHLRFPKGISQRRDDDGSAIRRRKLHNRSSSARNAVCNFPSIL